MCIGDKILEVLNTAQKPRDLNTISFLVGSPKTNVAIELNELITLGYVAQTRKNEAVFYTTVKQPTPTKKKPGTPFSVGMPRNERLKIIASVIKQHQPIGTRGIYSQIQSNPEYRQCKEFFTIKRISNDIVIMAKRKIIQQVSDTIARKFYQYAMIQTPIATKAPVATKATVDVHSGPQIATNPKQLDCIVWHQKTKQVSVFAVGELEEWIANGDIEPGDVCIKAEIHSVFKARAPKGVELDTAKVSEVFGLN